MSISEVKLSVMGRLPACLPVGVAPEIMGERACVRRYIFGIPGEENLDLLDSLRNSPIKLVVTRHEQAAGFMAATVGRLTGKAGCCLSTLGPGATNFTTAAAYAQLAGFPMVSPIILPSPIFASFTSAILL